MNTCWPLSNQRPLRWNDLVAPPNRGARSYSVTWAPRGGGHRRGQTSQSTSDHRNLRCRIRIGHQPGTRRTHDVTPARLRSATQAFSLVGNDIRPSSTAVGEAAIRANSRW